MDQIIDLLFPRRCPICQDIVMPKGKGVCASCEKKWNYLKEPLCKKCGKPVESQEIEYCFDCNRHPRSFEKGISLLDYSIPWVKAMLMEVKYHNHRQYLDFPCQELATIYKGQIKQWKADVLIPVPIHSSRRRKRGFNQAEEIAWRLEKEWEIPVDTRAFKRIKRTTPQKELNDRQRMKNLEEAFIVLPFVKQYHKVILIDDIYTTGSTAEACTRVLLEAGVKRVYVITLAIGTGL